MALSTAADSSGRFQVLTVTNGDSIEVWRATIDELLASSTFLTTGRILVDRRDAAPPLPPFVNQVVSYIEAHAQQFGPARVAVVAREGAVFGVARMTQQRVDLLGTTITTRVFHNYDEAVAWLIDSPTSDAR